VLLLHAWWGLNETFRGIADRLAQEGFVVLAPDLFGDGQAVTTVAEASERMDDLDDMRAEQIALGAIDRLFADPGLVGDRIGAVGFSMGANFGMWAALKRPDQVAANVLMYGSGAPGAGRSRVQGHFAPGDDWEPDDDVELMATGLRGAGRATDIYWYPGTRHWFFEPDRPEYDPAAADLAWSRMVPFLHDVLARETAESAR
jgi:carboxymethylenebutenolidase